MSSIEPVRQTHLVRNAPPRKVYDVVVDFAAYPRIFPEIAAARVIEQDAARVRAEFRLNLVLPIRYVVDLHCDPEALTVDWTFVEGEVVTGNQGAWRFEAIGTDTRVEYRVVLQVSAPIPEFMLRKVTDGLVRLSLPGMFKALEKEVAVRMSARS